MAIYPIRSHNQLPEPDGTLLAHSQRVFDYVREIINAAGGQIDFARYMELILYAPGLGYYSAGAKKFGARGDFVTAPEISPLFSRSIARTCAEVFAEMDVREILELGAGTGVMAADILLELERQNYLPQQYLILELSADLRERQKNYLRERCPHLLDRITWLDRLPEKPLSGLILANEVLDAMPVARFYADAENIQEVFVVCENDRLQNRLDSPRSLNLTEKVAGLRENFLKESDGYLSEINLQLDAFIASLSETLAQGVMLMIDYGFTAREYYHPQRNQGTLMCHYQHRAHADPLIFPGIQDVTAHVDFTAVATAAIDSGLQIAGYTTQAAFLLGCGIHELDAMMADPKQQLAISNQIKKLTLPSEMGELFKVIALSKNFNKELKGFSLFKRDLCGGLALRA